MTVGSTTATSTPSPGHWSLSSGPTGDAHAELEPRAWADARRRGSPVPTSSKDAGLQRRQPAGLQIVSRPLPHHDSGWIALPEEETVDLEDLRASRSAVVTVAQAAAIFGVDVRTVSRAIQ